MSLYLTGSFSKEGVMVVDAGPLYETRAFQASPTHPPVSITWNDLHLHSLVPVGPSLWQAYFVIRPLRQS